MGRTIPSYRMALEKELNHWKKFQEILRKDERAIFQDMTDGCRRHASAAGALCIPIIAEALFFTILFTHHQKLKELQERVNKTTETASHHQPKQHGLTILSSQSGIVA